MNEPTSKPVFTTMCASIEAKCVACGCVYEVVVLQDEIIVLECPRCGGLDAYINEPVIFRAPKEDAHP